MENQKIEKWDLVIVVERDETPPLICWGLVLTVMPSGKSYDVQIGDTRKDKRFVFKRNLIRVCGTNGKHRNPEEAVRAHLLDILLLITLISLTSRDYAALRRYKQMLEKHKKKTMREWLSILLHRI